MHPPAEQDSLSEERETMETRLCAHIATVKPSDLSERVMMAARRELIWCIGTSVAGASAPGSDWIHDYATSTEGREESTILGYGDRTPAHMAGMANGTYAKALEYEDKIWFGNTHGAAVGISVVPAALAIAESIGGVSGESLLAAIAVATDVQTRILMAPKDTLLLTGWNMSYLLAVFGAAGAAANLMQLDAQTTLNAMGLAYAQASGNRQGHEEGVLGVRMQVGFAVRNGIMAAQLAARGVTGVAHFLTGRYGLYPLFFGSVEVDLSEVTESLGLEYRGERLGFKGYPCGLVIHPALDGVRSLEGQYSPGDVTAVRVYGDERMEIMVEPQAIHRSPRHSIDAQFSAHWAVACTILDGGLQLRHYEPSVLGDQRYRALAQLVDIRLEGARGSSRVELDLRDGRTLRSSDVILARGHPDNPLSNEEISAVFADCITHAPSPLAVANAYRLPELILGAEAMPSTDNIMAALRPMPGPG